MKLLIIVIGLWLILFTACNKAEVVQSPNEPLSFISFKADNDTILQGKSTIVRVSASGKGVNYNWSSGGGDIYGAGPQITFGNIVSYIGLHTVTCTLSDAYGKSISKSIYIYVKPGPPPPPKVKNNWPVETENDR